MLGVLVVVASIAALDSLNPSTLVPALVLASRGDARRDVASFALGVFVVSTVAGLVLTFGPGRLVLESLGRPSAHTRHLVELATGVALIAAAALLWGFRTKVWGHRSGPATGRGSGLLGAGIMAAELPTAFPYFAAILAIVGGIRPAADQAAAVLLYNAIFVVPLAAIWLVASPARAAAFGDLVTRVQRYLAVVVPAGVASIGVALAVVGGTHL